MKTEILKVKMTLDCLLIIAWLVYFYFAGSNINYGALVISIFFWSSSYGIRTIKKPNDLNYNEGENYEENND